MNVVELFDGAVRAARGTTAIIDGPAGRERLTTFAEFDDRSRRIAALLAAVGLPAGSGVVVMVPMSARLYEVVAAILRLGLVAVFMDPAAGDAHFRACARRFPLSGFIGTPAACLLRLLRPALRAIPRPFVAGPYFPGATPLAAARRHAPLGRTVERAAEDPAMLAFTSGTSGRPKGMARSHGLLAATQAALAGELRLAAGEVSLATMPVFALINLACGATTLIPDLDLRRPGAVDPGRLAGQLRRWQVRSIVASPALVARLAERCVPGDPALASVARFFVGGAPVFPRLLGRLAEVTPEARTRILYGSTEAEPIAGIAAAELTPAMLRQVRGGHGLPVGRPVPQVAVRVLADRWGEPVIHRCAAELDAASLPAGRPGEIVVSGAHVVPGYLGGEGEAASKFRVDGTVWHRTGDAGWLDDAGRLWLLGRCADRVDGPAGALYPTAIEAALSFQSELRRTAFLHHRGARLVVIETVDGRPPFDPAALGAEIAWAAPETLVQVARIPVDARHNAKVDYPALRVALDAGAERWRTPVNATG